MPITAKTLQKFFEVKLEAEFGPFDLKRLMDEEKKHLTILDVRRAEDFDKEHLPGAVNIPLEALQNRWKEIPKKNRVVAYCYAHMCSLAPKAALFLAKKGYRTGELVGGIAYWKNAGFEVRSGRTAEKGELITA